MLESGGRVFKRKLYTHKVQKLIYPHLVEKLFHKDFSLIIRRNTDGVLN